MALDRIPNLKRWNCPNKICLRALKPLDSDQYSSNASSPKTDATFILLYCIFFGSDQFYIVVFK